MILDFILVCLTFSRDDTEPEANNLDCFLVGGLGTGPSDSTVDTAAEGAALGFLCIRLKSDTGTGLLLDGRVGDIGTTLVDCVDGCDSTFRGES